MKKARRWQKRLERGTTTKAALAREAGIPRARVTQIMGLLKLAPEVQEAILEADPVEVGVRGVTERRLGRLCSLPPAEQLAAIGALLDRTDGGRWLSGVAERPF